MEGGNTQLNNIKENSPIFDYTFIIYLEKYIERRDHSLLYIMVNTYNDDLKSGGLGLCIIFFYYKDSSIIIVNTKKTFNGQFTLHINEHRTGCGAEANTVRGAKRP